MPSFRTLRAAAVVIGALLASQCGTGHVRVHRADTLALPVLAAANKSSWQSEEETQ